MTIPISTYLVGQGREEVHPRFHFSGSLKDPQVFLRHLFLERSKKTFDHQIRRRSKPAMHLHLKTREFTDRRQVHHFLVQRRR